MTNIIQNKDLKFTNGFASIIDKVTLHSALDATLIALLLLFSRIIKLDKDNAVNQQLCIKHYYTH